MKVLRKMRREEAQRLIDGICLEIEKTSPDEMIVVWDSIPEDVHIPRHKSPVFSSKEWR